jgi:hypothetical protein
MADYYLDIETTGTDVKKDTILTIQFQKLGAASGRTDNELKILKSWESSEKEILNEFFEIFDPFGKDKFSFIPIGMSLHFEFFMLHNRWKKNGIDVPLKTLIYDIPHVDIKSILVILNGGKFRGASLDNFTGKTSNGAVIPEYYANRDFEKIEDYIKKEAEEFIKFYQMIKKNLPKLSFN